MEIACRAFIFWQKKILLCRQREPSRGFWTIPGGSVKDGETLVECIRRELLEETNIVFETESLLFIRELINSSRHRIEFYFSVKKLENQDFYKEIKPYNEIGDIRFFKIEELEFIDFKPNCLSDLVQEIKKGDTIFPRYLGNIE